MIQYKKGNILDIHTEVLVNSVNTVGIMGKGIALSIKKTFPDNYEKYRTAFEKGELQIGKLFITETGQLYPKYIVNFPTKVHWKHPSKIEYIDIGLKELTEFITHKEIKSIVIPPLGCGNGKLEWEKVKSLLESHLSPLKNCEIYIVEPGFKPAEEKIPKKLSEVELTSARAMLLLLFRKYQEKDYSLNLLVTQKLAYFLQMLGEPLRLQFSKGWYGPFAPNLNKVLQVLNNKYIYYDASDIRPGNKVGLISKYDDEINRFIDEKLTDEQKDRLNLVLKIIDGFETPFSLEVLGSVDFVLRENKNLSPEEILQDIRSWSKRKSELIKPYHIEVACKRLHEYSAELGFK